MSEAEAALYVAGWLAAQDTAEMWPAPPPGVSAQARVAWHQGYHRGCVVRLTERLRGVR
jgi:hypothetical protein